MPTELSLGLRAKHSNPQQHSPAVRPSGSPEHNPEGYSVGRWRKHAGYTEPSLQLTVARKCREISHHTHGTDPRTLRAQIEKNCNTIIGARHPITPWIVRHAAYLLNRYAVHSDGMTSYYRRWHREHKTPLCEFGEMVQRMIQATAYRAC